MRSSLKFPADRLFLLATIAFGLTTFFSGCQTPETPAKTQTLTIFRPAFDPVTGKVTINGVDSRQPSIPFSWSWGDGRSETGWFPLTHVYADKQRDYVVTVAAHYDGHETSQAQTVVSFPKN